MVPTTVNRARPAASSTSIVGRMRESAGWKRNTTSEAIKAVSG